MIILRSLKGWTGPKFVDGKPVEGTWRAHQVPVTDLATKPGHLKILALQQVAKTWNDVRDARYDVAIDLQGAMRSAVLARWAGARVVYGAAEPRESPASLWYTRRVIARGPHVIEQYTVVDGGPYTDGESNFTSMISLFKSKNAEVFSNCPLPPDFNTFWTQASQQGFKPKIATVAKVLLFPADTTALGPLVNNIATDSWWGPYMPYKSSLSGVTASALASAFQSSTGNQWVQSIGSTYSLFEVAKEAFGSVSDPHDRAEVANALHNVSYQGICGPLDFATGPAPGVGIIKPVGVQWKKSTGKYPFEMQVVDNSLNASVPVGANLDPTYA